MPESQTTEDGSSTQSAPGHLSLRSFTIVMVILLGIFVLLNPIWESTEMDLWNENIWWSYIPIPILAAIFLAYEKKLGWASLFLDSMKLTFLKFGITFIGANLLWTYWGTPGTGIQPGNVGSTESAETLFSPKPAPSPTTLEPGALGSLSGRVTGVDQEPIAGTLVRISGGLEDYVFAPPTAPLLLTNDGTGFFPDQQIAQIFQPVSLQSTTSGIHTVVMSSSDRRLMMNFPVLPEKTRELMFDRALGEVTVACSVHGSDETETGLLVVSNPFHTRTDAAGRFRFEGVPRGSVELSITTKTGSRHTQTTGVDSETELEISLLQD